jgi:hypothetical protein
MLNQQVSKSDKRIPIENLIAGLYATKIRKGAAVYHLRDRSFIQQVVEVLQDKQSEHPFQRIEFVTPLPLIIVQLNDLFPPIPGNDLGCVSKLINGQKGRNNIQRTKRDFGSDVESYTKRCRK